MAGTVRQIEDVQGVETHSDVDPTHTSIDTAANQMGALVIGIRDHIIGPATQLRDRIDGVIRNTNKRADDLTAEIERFRNDGNSAIKSIGIMADGCDKLIQHMGEHVPDTVTHLPRRQRMNGQD
jgi:hypothetical protein